MKSRPPKKLYAKGKSTKDIFTILRGFLILFYFVSVIIENNKRLEANLHNLSKDHQNHVVQHKLRFETVQSRFDKPRRTLEATLRFGTKISKCV